MAYKITDICVACGTCIDECPVGAISEGDIYKICYSGGLIAHRLKEREAARKDGFFIMQ